MSAAPLRSAAKLSPDEAADVSIRRPTWQDIWFDSEDSVDLSHGSFIGKAFHYVIRLPVTMLLRLAIPPPAEEVWDRRFAAISPVGSCLIIFFFYNRIVASPPIAQIVWTTTLFGVVPWLALALMATIALGVKINWTTHRTRAPSYIVIFTLTSVVISVHCIWLASSFIVKYLDILGFSMRIPSVYLGITLLSFGNSLGGTEPDVTPGIDIIADLIVAKRGFVVMGITSTFSSPMFNVLVGQGVSLIALMVKNQ